MAPDMPLTRPPLHFIVAVICTALWSALSPACWRPVVRSVLVRQIYTTTLGALPLTLLVAFGVGVAVVAQVGLWLESVGQSELFAALVAAVLVEHLAPLIVNFFLISRSGTAITTELANMVVNREIRVLEGQGIDTFVYLVIPRVLGMALSVLCLSLAFIAAALYGGYLYGLMLTSPALGGPALLRAVDAALAPATLLAFAANTLLPGLLTGAICAVTGLTVKPLLSAVPQAAAAAVMRSIGALFALTVTVSLLGLLWP